MYLTKESENRHEGKKKRTTTKGEEEEEGGTTFVGYIAYGKKKDHLKNYQ